MMVFVPRIGRSPGTVKLPESFTEPAEVATLLDHAATMICEEWLQRRRLGTKASDVTSVPWLERTCYEVLTAYLKAEQSEAIEARIESHRRNIRGPKSNQNIFQKGMMAITADQGDAIARRDRERIGKRLWHAYRHYVPPAFLMGFFKQIDSGALLRRAADNQIEPGFDEWIALQMLDDDQIDERGVYPTRIVKLSSTLVREDDNDVDVDDDDDDVIDTVTEGWD